MKNYFKNILISTFFPLNYKCIFCGDEINNELSTCDNCLKTLPFIQNYNTCIVCGEQINTDGKVCINCKAMNRFFEKAISVFYYTGKIHFLLLQFKFNNKKFYGNIFSKFMYEKFLSENISIDLIIPVPTTISTLKKRKYNQAELLCNEFSKNGYTVLTNLISKLTDTHQYMLNYSERIKNMNSAFVLENSAIIKNKTILIVDDVYTTGATSNTISKLLKEHGAIKVYVLTLCHSPYFFNTKFL